VKQLVRFGSHAALWVLALVILAGTLGAIVGVASAASPTYTLTGVVRTTTGAPVPIGTQVDVVSKATGAVCTTTTGGTGGIPSGQFKFNSTGTNACAGLQPGYWGVYVPDQTNLSLAGCRPFSCAIIPQNVTPAYYYLNATQLTTQNYAIGISNVSYLPYETTLSGNVTFQGVRQPGAVVSLLQAQYSGVVFVNNTTNVNGTYSLKVPMGGPWVLETRLNGNPPYNNFTQVTIPSRATVHVDPALNNFLVSGILKDASTGLDVATQGNVTLIDPSAPYIYTDGTAGGYYSIGTYPARFTSGTKTFDVILSEQGYATSWYYLPANGPVTRNVNVDPVKPSQLGVYSTTINLTKVNFAAGAGNISVVSTAYLGNDSVVPSLPNGTVGQLWAQLGLAYDGSVNYSASNNAALQAWLAANGPTFPAQQAGFSIDGTTLLNPLSTPTLANFTTTCTSGNCGLSTSGGSISYGWNSVFPLNGTVPLNSSNYTVSFGFSHPPGASDVYNYTVALPSGYALAAGTSAPTRTTLAPAGPGGTWTAFTLSSLPSPTPSGTASFSIVRVANLEANVSATVKNFAFSSKNVLNSTHGNYTVIVGAGQNVTFSTLNSTYPAGTNGTKFVWNFGDGTPIVTRHTPTTNHTYQVVSGATPYRGTVNITSSGGQVNNTTFYVWVAQKGGVTAVITGNWTHAYTSPAAYARINWSNVIRVNATGSSAVISSKATVPNVISVASWTITAKGYKQTKNITASTGGTPLPGNWTPSFLGAGNYYTTDGIVGGQPVPLTGWQYNISLTVWSGTGQSATTTFRVLVNDTEPPTPAFTLQNATGTVISGSGLQVGLNDTAKVVFNAANSTDPHNGSLVRYYWLLTNPGNSSVHRGWNYTSVKPNGSLPAAWLNPQQKAYVVNLTVWDLNGNHAYANQSLTVSPNSKYRPILSASNLTAPKTFTVGSSSVIWVNITVGGGSLAVARNLTVRFYLLSSAGTGTGSNIAGSPGSVQFFNYTGGVVNTVPLATGLLLSLALNHTVRAEVHWNPIKSGNFVLYANASASNEYAGDYINGPQTVQQSITVNPNPTTTLLTYAGIAAVVIVVVVLLILFYRRRTRGPTTTTRTSITRTTTSGKGRAKDGEDEDEEDEDT
jgi:hypothetical protein